MNRSRLKVWILTSSVVSPLLYVQSLTAQVVPDATLQVGERSQVSGNPNVQIDGGARRGGNLFHSFSQFSIPTDGSAYFNNAVDVQNIFSRVTGGSISNIDGLIRANGTANLFVLNPNGILFGPNASLNIGGSFVATTANAIGLANGDIFSANPGQPLPSQLLNINPNALFFNQMAAPAIVNQSTFNNTGLQVPQRQNLLLVGGPVQLDGGQLISPGSYVELGSVGGVGIVDLSTVQEDWQLNIPGGVTRADALLRNAGDINVKGDGGSIRILAQNIDIFGSTLRIEIPSDSRLPATQTGDIELNATGSITLRDSVLANSLFGQGTMGRLILTAGDRITINGSGLFSTAEPGGVGDIGNVTMTAGTIVFDGALFVANTSQQTDASNVFINARDAVSFNGSLVFNTVEQTGIGNGGDINITTGSLALTNGAQLISKTSGQGNAGNVNIAARDAVSLDGSGSIIFNTLEPTGIGKGGNINITTGSLALTNGAQLISKTSGQGNAGNVNIAARDAVSLDGSGSIIFNTLEPTGIGKGGNINITTGSLALTNGAQLISNTSGQGNAGSVNINAHDAVSLDGSFVFNTVNPTGIGNAGGINITTGSLSLTVGSQVNSFTEGRGNAGSVNIQARDTVSLDQSGMLNNVSLDAIGNAGDINITTGSLALTKFSAVNSFLYGQGNAGNITIDARDTISLDRSFITNGVSSSSFGASRYFGVGNAGNVNITTGSLSLTVGSQVNSFTGGRGNAGSVNIQARDTISLDNDSVMFNNVFSDAIGNSGGINITTGSLYLTRFSFLNSETAGQGNAGSVNIQARDTVALDGTFGRSGILTQVNGRVSGQGGDITIATGSLFLINGGILATRNIGGNGNAGRVTIQARDAVQIRGITPNTSTEYSQVITLANTAISPIGQAAGNGGDVTIATGSLLVSDQGRIVTNVRGQGRAGNIRIQAIDTVSFDGGDAISTLDEEGVGRGGDIDITARSLSVLNNAQLSASTSGDGDAGNITVSADTVGVSSRGQLLTTTSSNGRAGDITVNTPDLQLSGANSGLFAGTNSIGNAGNLTVQPRGDGQSVRVNLQDGAQISASTFNRGKGGELTITAPDSITLTGNGSVIAAGTDASGDGGNLNLRTRNLNIQNQAQVTVSSSGTGSAGNLFVNADRIFLNNQGSIRADTLGGGGNINLRSPLIVLRNGSNITTNATGANIPGGNIGIDTRFLVAVPNEDSNISANSENFRGGNVRINAFSIFGIQSSLVSTSLSDITATGATSALSGTTNVNTAGIDPTSGLVALPTDFVDPSGLIAQGCPANQGNSFVISGRGGLPPTPEQQLDDDANWQDRRRLVANQQVDGRGQGNTETASLLNSPSLPHTPIIEATGWLITPTGEISLVASTSNPTMQNRLKWSGVCSRGKSSK